MPDEAFERALEALSRKERTAAELGGWLAKRGITSAEIETVVERLVACGALDDEAFAHRYAADKRDLRGWGPQRIRESLAGRGLDRGLIDAALAKDPREDQLARATELLERRGETPADAASRARALGFLARRGYDSDLAHDAVRRVERRAA